MDEVAKEEMAITKLMSDRVKAVVNVVLAEVYQIYKKHD
jgi:hypothetical protein